MTDAPREFTDMDRRVFGLVVGGLLCAAAFLSWRKGGGRWLYLGPVGASFLLAAAAAPSTLAPVLRVWMRFAVVMAAVNTAVLMGLLWVLVFVPWGLLRGLLRVDLLDQGFRTGKSYWRDHPPREPESYKRLF